MNEQMLCLLRNSALKHRLLFGILLLVHPPSTAFGQQLVSGDAIRVRPSESTESGRQWTDGIVVRVTSDTLWYQAS